MVSLASCLLSVTGSAWRAVREQPGEDGGGRRGVGAAEVTKTGLQSELAPTPGKQRTKRGTAKTELGSHVLVR